MAVLDLISFFEKKALYNEIRKYTNFKAKIHVIIVIYQIIVMAQNKSYLKI